ncbi:MAG TPA: AAA family ATPase, partial [Vicinamibacteria bacterium]
MGRTAEIERLMRLVGAARQGEAQVAVIAGPAGIGKTRLTEEVAARARRRRARVAIGQCWHDGEAPPLWPWLTVLRQLEAPALLDDAPGQPARGRFARFVSVLEYLRDAADEGPFVIVVDDVHLADPATLLLARFLARERRGLPLVLLLTRRDPAPAGDPEARELLAELERDALAITLAALSADAVGSYLADAGVAAADPALLDVVTAVTNGNPLHLRTLALRSELGTGLRGGLEHAVGRLLEQLSPEHRRLVGLAAVLGPEVAVHEVARVAEAAPGLVAETLARAAELALMVERGEGRLAFIHDLVREAAESALAVADRLEAHARAAALLTGHDAAGRLRRAHHALTAASRSRKDASLAVASAREAARALLGVDGFESAAALLGRAVEVQEAAALTMPAAELMTERAEAVLACGRLAEARALFRQAARVAEAERDPAVLARAALGLGGVWLAEHRAADEA